MSSNGGYQLRSTAWIIGALVVFISSAACQAQTELRTVTSFASNQIFARELGGFIRAMNTAAGDQAKFRLIGGPEAIPPPQIADAVKNGIVDVIYAPASFYRGQLPEVDALSASTKLPWEVRDNGGFAALDRVYQAKLNAKLLAWSGTGFGYHLFLRSEPKRTADGGLDLKGLKLRSGPMYKEFFSILGIVNVAIQPTEIYVAMERGVVEGVGWPTLGISDLGWDKFIRYRVDPPFLSGDAVVAVNLRKWTALSEGLRERLEQAARAYEHTAVEFYRREITAELGRLEKAGIKRVEIGAAAQQRYLDTAYDEVWKRLETSGSPHAKELKAKFYR